jgi:hypothetical protein
VTLTRDRIQVAFDGLTDDYDYIDGELSRR